MKNDFRSSLLMAAFFMSVIMLWDHWRLFHGEASLFAPPAQVAAVHAPEKAVTREAGAAGTPAAPGSAAAGASAEFPEQQVTVATDVVRATLDTRGGDLVDLDLLKFQENDSHSELVSIFKRLLGIKTDPVKNGDVQVFDTAPGQYYVAQTGLSIRDSDRPLPQHTTVMRLASADRALAPGKDTLSVRFESPVVGGLQLVKTYTFHRGGYAIDVSHEVVNRSGAPVSPDLYLQLVRDGRVPGGGYFSGPSSYTGPSVYRDGTFHKISFSDIDKGKEKDSVDPRQSLDNGWIAMVQHYFSSAWVLPGNAARSYSFGHFGAEVHGQPTYFAAIFTSLGTVAPGASKTVSATLFAGPSEEDLLAPLGLQQVKDYGMLKIVAQPLFWLLSQIHRFVGNWGWSIVGLVFLLKIAFYSLNANAYRSMAKMKAVNPRIQELRERYKDNPQQMQAETMKIYRDEKVNPLGGCLPILIQMPIFIALFTVLTSTVEMRGAPWVGWIRDLSVMDPYAILPVLMTLSGLAQVALQPAPADPMQARMMWIMPIVFSLALFTFPSGLVLYYVTNNLLTIVQQWLINRQINGPASGGAGVSDAKAAKG
jgi:YidC/Oxa1 family membrane protein insertase